MPRLDLYLPLAHADEFHWYFLLIGAIPVLLVVYGAFRTTRDEQRKDREEEPSTASERE